jgi:hypothetical protein
VACESPYWPGGTQTDFTIQNIFPRSGHSARSARQVTRAGARAAARACRSWATGVGMYGVYGGIGPTGPRSRPESIETGAKGPTIRERTNGEGREVSVKA